MDKIFKTDVSNGKTYVNNVPSNDIVNYRYGNYTKGEFGTYTVLAMNGNNNECWHDGKFVGDEYAVFHKSKDGSFCHQVSNWYCKYGNAKRKAKQMFDKKCDELGLNEILKPSLD